MTGKHDRYIDEALADIRDWLSAPGRLAPFYISTTTCIVRSASKYDGEYRTWISSDIDDTISPMIDVESMTPIDILLAALEFESEVINQRAQVLKEVFRDATAWQ